MNDCLKRGWGWGLILLLGASLIPVGPAGAKEKVLIVGDYSPLNNPDPTSSVISQYIMFSRNLFQGLLRYKFNSTELEGDLAKSWTLSKDRLVYTFKLRDNIKWHKGFGKVTAQDVKFSFDRVMDPETRSPFRGEVVAVEKFGKDFARNPIGTGPFIFDSWTREQVVLLGNKEFQQREGPPKIDKMIYKAVPDVDTLLTALQKGDVDVVWVLPRDQAVIDKLDDLIEKARKERNEKIRFQYYHEFQKKFMEALPDIPLMMVDYPLAFRSHISGLPERDFI